MATQFSGYFASFHEPAKMSKLEENEEGGGMHDASAISAQPEGENCTQVDNYNIRTHLRCF